MMSLAYDSTYVVLIESRKTKNNDAFCKLAHYDPKSTLIKEYTFTEEVTDFVMNGSTKVVIFPKRGR